VLTPRLLGHGSPVSTPAVSQRGSLSTPTLPRRHCLASADCQSATSSFKAVELQIGRQPFDPNSATIKPQLLSLLGIHRNTSFSCLGSNSGGLNEGLWTLHAHGQDLIIKLVGASRQESDKLVQLSARYPDMASDSMLAFPLQVVRCVGTDGTHRYDLVVMKRARGTRLGDYVGEKWYGGESDKLMQVLWKLGSCLRKFHSRYGHSQHGDFQPSNIFYDEDSNNFTFIDVADIGRQGNDIEHFLKSLKILAGAYGPKFLCEASGAFECGYRL